MHVGTQDNSEDLWYAVFDMLNDIWVEIATSDREILVSDETARVGQENAVSISVEEASGGEIVITYRNGGGTVGNIVTNAINIQRQEIVPGYDFGVTVTYTNYTNGEFGYNGDGVEEIRKKLPAYLETKTY